MERLYEGVSFLVPRQTRIRRKIKFRCCHWNLLLYTLIAGVGFLLFKELFGCSVWAFFWPPVTCGLIRELHPVLLVASPRILGERSNSWFTRWYDDRYLRRSFASALQHVDPDLVIFLGNLMDEGSLATDKEYRRYFQRFKDIFKINYISPSKTIFIPGDRDIGRDTMIKEQRRYRFVRHFKSPAIRSVSNVQIIQVDRPEQSMPPLMPDHNWTRVVISHLPLLASPDVFTQKILQKLRPHAMLSAQDYTDVSSDDQDLVQFSGDVITGNRLTVEVMNASWCTWGSPEQQVHSWRFQWSDRQVSEVVVPACSSRSSETDLGYGVAVFDRRREAWCFHVLWLPSDLYMVYAYLCTVAVLLATVVVFQCYRKYFYSCHKAQTQYEPLRQNELVEDLELSAVHHE